MEVEMHNQISCAVVRRQARRLRQLRAKHRQEAEKKEDFPLLTRREALWLVLDALTTPPYRP